MADILTTNEDPIATGKESSLSNWAGDYVTNMLGKGQALANEGYNAYTGPLSAGSSDLQDAAFQGVGGLAMPTDEMGVGGFTPESYTGENVGQYMNPYLMQSLQPQIDEARRQSEIDRIANAGRMTRAGSFGGSRQAVLDAENQYGTQRNIANLVGQGYNTAFNNAQNQFNTEQDRGMTAQQNINEYGMAGLGALADLGNVQRNIESEGIAADRAQFEEERDFPYKQTQYMQSLLQNLPIASQNVTYQEPSYLQQLQTDSSDFNSFMMSLFGSQDKTSAGGGGK
tara:strand:- start:2146 stop:2997 length:852 start_codon:yes stop_codon:yes gene_type:complete